MSSSGCPHREAYGGHEPRTSADPNPPEAVVKPLAHTHGLFGLIAMSWMGLVPKNGTAQTVTGDPLILLTATVVSSDSTVAGRGRVRFTRSEPSMLLSAELVESTWVLELIPEAVPDLWLRSGMLIKIRTRCSALRDPEAKVEVLWSGRTVSARLTLGAPDLVECP